ncbi:hypothetical protein O181_030379 [Austropuccinia psidii MF-1]|uniref:DUF4939 domain-containing protein n=1 Tax=Austropuccinia psidii MF-1 TaxID=1389203 RepID=A0A9Q3CSS7_9BASI|nr:hypothetical protein [Austropuccinia psidii MF-1]
MEGAALFIQEARGPRRSSSFSGVVCAFPGISRTTFRGPGEDGEDEEENSVEEEESDGTEVVPDPLGQMTQIMANIQEASRPSTFKTPSMKAPEFFDRTQPFKVRSFIQSCQLIFHNDQEYFSEYSKKVLCATSFLIGRDAKWIELYISNLNNKEQNYLLNNWALS